jgi:hypothetical protein
MSRLPSVIHACQPRSDVLQGGLTDAHFAAQLDRIVRTPGDYPAYGNPEAFFELTYPTKGLRELLQRTFGRISGARVPGGEHGLIRSETSFGGGKTHGLIAAYHLAKGARPANLIEFIDPSLLPERCQIAALVGDSLDPVNGTLTDGRTAFTLWGEIGAQLGAHAFEVLRQSDVERTAPSKDTLADAFAGAPTIIIIDEIAQYLRQLTSSGNEGVRRLAQALPVFLKNLLELAAGDSRVVVILTLASRLDAFQGETGELDELLREAQANLEGAGRETASVAGRFTSGGSIVVPAEEAEIGEILKRRLFERIDTDAANRVALAFEQHYETLLTRGEQLPGGASKPASYAQSVATSYPLHPELIRVLDQRLGTIPNFQRARGALKLLAEVVSGVWGDQTHTPILNVGDLHYESDHVLNHLTTGLGRGEFEQVARSDFASPSSYAAQIDETRMIGKDAITRRAASTVFTHSLELTNNTGAARQDVILGTLRPGESPDVLIEALNALDESAWFLDYENSRYRFRTEPNPNAIIAAAEKDFTKSRVHESMRHRVEEAFPTDRPIHVIHYPVGYQEVPDHPRQYRLVIMHYDNLTTRSGERVPSALIEILDKTGASGAVRMNRNGLAFLVADRGELPNFEQRVRRDLAAQATVEDPARMQEFSDHVRKRIQAIADTTKLDARIALTRTFKHLYTPSSDRANGYLRHEELSPQAQGDVKRAQTRVLLNHLQEQEKVRTAAPGIDYLRAKAWPNEEGRVSTDDLMAAFWRDHGLAVILDATILQTTIRKGVESGRWIYHDPSNAITGTSKTPPGSIRIAEDAYLYTPERAQEDGLLVKPVRAADLSDILTTQERVTGVTLRAELEGRIGGEPSKGEVLQALANAATGGENARVFVTRGEPIAGQKPLPPSEITKVGLDTLTILSKTAAEAAGLDLGRASTLRPIEARGAVGEAYQRVLTQVEDAAWPLGIQRIDITAFAEIETGIKPIRELHQAITMVPNVPITTKLNLTLDFAPLSGETTISIQGGAKDLQRVEDAIFTLANRATELEGTLTLTATFDPPAQPTDPRIEKLRKALTLQQPGEVTVKAYP